VRNIINQNPDDVLRRIAEIGYREVELGRADLPKLAPILKKYNLKPVSCHIEPGYITGRWDPKEPAAPKWKDAVADAKQYGVEYMVMAYIFPQDRGGPDVIRRLADKMNEAAAEVHAAGLQFAYHNHAFEFQGERGHRPIDIMLEEFKKGKVGLEMDVFWVSVGGNDPVQMLKELKGRVPLIHLKDKVKDAPIMYAENVKRDAFKEVGTGSLDFAAVLNAAKDAGVKHYFVEQDQTPGDPIASLKTSYENLRKY
jgi:sugar phosphate isomerase/epimerase